MKSGKNSSPILISRNNSPKSTEPENRGKLSELRPAIQIISRNDQISNRQRRYEHRIAIQNEQSNLLEYEEVTGMLSLDKITTYSRFSIALSCFEFGNKAPVDARLTRKELSWGSRIILLDDVISVSYSSGSNLFTVHTYPVKRSSCGLRFWRKTRSQKDFSFLASSPQETYDWVNGFARHQCFMNKLIDSYDYPPMPNIKSKTPLKVLVILNPRSGSGHSSNVFTDTVEPIFKLAGFQMQVVNTESAGHAKSFVATVDFSTCPDGIICIGGDGIVNEVLNGLLIREDQKRAITIPMGIIPAGSDNSLSWTVLGVCEPATAAVSIVKGGLITTDVLVVKWVQTGLIHFGMTVSYFGFVSDALELSDRYQKHCGPLRYMVAGIQKFLCMPDYNFEVEYLPIEKNQSRNVSADRELENLQTVVNETAPVIPSSGGDATHVCNEPSDNYDPKSKQQPCCSSSSGRRRNIWEEAEVIHPQTPRSTTTRNLPRTRPNATTPTDNRHKWDSESNSNNENPIEIADQCGDETRDAGNNWVMAKGQFLGILICNHACRTVQNASQVVAPHARHDDRSLDLVLVRGSGRFRLLRFFVEMHLGRHLSLPYVDYVKVKSVKVKQSNSTKTGCGLDGELIPVSGQVVTSLFHEQCLLIGKAST